MVGGIIGWLLFTSLVVILLVMPPLAKLYAAFT